MSKQMAFIETDNKIGENNDDKAVPTKAGAKPIFATTSVDS